MSDSFLFLALLLGKSLPMIYFIIYLATVLFGNIAAFFSFWIIFEAHLGALSLIEILLVIFLADVSGDLLWYSIGNGLRGTKFGYWIETHLPGHTKAETMLQKRGAQWIVFSKFVFGFAPAVVFSVGWSGVDFRTFFRKSLISSMLWVPVLGGVVFGIVSGLSPLIPTSFKRIEWVILAGLLAFIVVDYLVLTIIKLVIDRFTDDGDKTAGLTN